MDNELGLFEENELEKDRRRERYNRRASKKKNYIPDLDNDYAEEYETYSTRKPQERYGRQRGKH